MTAQHLFPMIAVGKVTIGKAQYRPDEPFDAGTQKDFDYLKASGHAKPSEVKTPEASGLPSTPVAQTGNEAPRRMGLLKRSPKPVSQPEEKGKPNVESPTIGGRGSNSDRS